MRLAFSKLRAAVVEEIAVGQEDRVFRTDLDEWWWQARGSADVFGPFRDRDSAETDYNFCEVECAYCGMEHTQEDEKIVPAIDNDEEWARLAKQHAPDCEWIRTRAHRVIN